MFDLVIRGGTVVDGTGSAPVVADVAVADGRIAEIGKVDGAAARTVDADGLAVAPGFIDPHTHYDAQLFWDPAATPSPLHGVTTVLGGNCGFSLAPVNPDDARYLQEMMAMVEGMPLVALEQGLPWDWETFGEFLDRLDGQTAVNAGFLVGHSALRRYVMGSDADQPADPGQLDKMVQALHDGLAAGGMGFSTSLAHTPLGRQQRTRAQPVLLHRRGAGSGRGSVRPSGHLAGVHHLRLSEHLQRRRDRPDEPDVGSGPSGP